MSHTVKSFSFSGPYPVYETMLHQRLRPVHGKDGQTGYVFVNDRDVLVVYDAELQMWVTPAFKLQSQKPKEFSFAAA